MAIRWGNYPAHQSFDELIEKRNTPRATSKALCDFLYQLKDKDLKDYRDAAGLAIKLMGITFTVYSHDEDNIDREWPFDIIPRVISKQEWLSIDAGLKQRTKALNLFIADIYDKQQIIKDKVFPKELLENSSNFRPQCVGMKLPNNVWAHICGSDLVRDHDGTVYVLEDNLRVPSGVSYMLENRKIMKRIFPDLFEAQQILPVDDYPSQLFNMLSSLSPRKVLKPEIVVLTPGIYNSAYFEHSYLAQQMGVELVENLDLVVGKDDCVYMRTIDGLTRVDVIYRRIDDLYLDPEAFNPDSLLGVKGLMRAWKSGNVALANAPGAGVADDKVVYAYVPEIIKYYLDEEPLIPNVPTYRCFIEDEKNYVLSHLNELVVKPANESGGYGMLIGPHSTKEERKKFAALIKKDPRNYIAQPMLNLSTAPTLIGNKAEPRHLDLRPFILSGKDINVTTGGLTRVAMNKGSIVVNSSQGGGSKDTWIVDLEDKADA